MIGNERLRLCKVAGGRPVCVTVHIPPREISLFPSPPRKRGSIAGQVRCQTTTCCTVQPWIPAPRFRGDELRGNDGGGICPITCLRALADKVLSA